MSEHKTPTFRNSMSGFNKKDVNEYLVKINRDFEEKTAADERRIASLTEELNAARAELEELKSQMESAPPAAETAAPPAAREYSQITPEVELARANAIIAAQTERMETMAKEKDVLEASLSEIKAKLSEYSENEAKLEEYKSMTNKMGEIYMGATADAERIRAEAEEKAQEMLRETEKKCDVYRIELEMKLEEFAATRKNDLALLFDSTQKQISELINGFSEKSKELASEALCAGFDFSKHSGEAK